MAGIPERYNDVPSPTDCEKNPTICPAHPEECHQSCIKKGISYRYGCQGALCCCGT